MSSRLLKSSNSTVEQLYEKALAEEPRLQKLIKNANREGKLTTTKDWSFVATRMTGENWFLVGEALGFADPILSAGLSLTHASARELASLILEVQRSGDAKWACAEYERRNSSRVLQHIRFADYWYTANTHFSDLKQYTAEIAKDVGLSLTADQAFQWLGTGGFVEEDMEVAGLALIRLDQLQQVAGKLSGTPSTSAIDGFNVFLLRAKGAEEVKTARFGQGKVVPIRSLKRDGKFLPLNGLFGWVIEGLKHSPKWDEALAFLEAHMRRVGHWQPTSPARLTECLDAMVRDGWVKAKTSDALSVVEHKIQSESTVVRSQATE